MKNYSSIQRSVLTLVAIVVAIAIMAMDLIIPLGVAGGVPYIIIVLLGLWAKGKRFVIISAIAGSLLVVLGYFFSPPGGELWKVIFNRFLALFSIWVTAILCILYKNFEEKLEETNRQLTHSEKLSASGKLAASIAHEFNNPLCGIRNTLERLQEKVPMGNEFSYSTRIAINECNRVIKLISQLNNFYQPSKSDIETFDLHEAIDEIITLMSNSLNDEKITFEKYYCQKNLEIKAIPDQIKQVILNLIQNAEESYRGDFGKIIISTEQLTSEIKIQVKDLGQGITKDNLDKIFDPFFTTKKNVKGIGLGLSISYGIIESHGGLITAVSEAGKGTCFTIILPIDGNFKNE